MVRRNNTIIRKAHECFHSRDTKCWSEVTHSLAAGSSDGDSKANFNDQQKIGETFLHLKSTKFSHPWFSQNRRQSFGNNSFHLNSIRCKRRHWCYNNIGVAQQWKPKFLLPWENSLRTLKPATEKHSLLSKCQFTISCEHNNLFHFNFVSKLQSNMGIYIIQASFKFSNFDFWKVCVTSRCCVHETWSLEFHMIACMTNH